MVRATDFWQFNYRGCSHLAAGWHLGSQLRTAQARSFSLDWPILLPVRQHVPGHGELEHEWKDGDPWRLVADTSLEQRPSHFGNSGVALHRSVNGEVHPSSLTAIMEGKAKPVSLQNHVSITHPSHTGTHPFELPIQLDTEKDSG